MTERLTDEERDELERLRSLYSDYVSSRPGGNAGMPLTLRQLDERLQRGRQAESRLQRYEKALRQHHDVMKVGFRPSESCVVCGQALTPVEELP